MVLKRLYIKGIMSKYLFKGVKQTRFETPEQKKKRIQEQFLFDYHNYCRNENKKNKEIIRRLRNMLGI